MVPARPNIDLIFNLIDKSKSPLQSSPSSLNPEAWYELLRGYLGSLGTTVFDNLIYGTQIGAEGLEYFILLRNLISSETNRPFIIS